jgi:hypothetical protein
MRRVIFVFHVDITTFRLREAVGFDFSDGVGKEPQFDARHFAHRQGAHVLTTGTNQRLHRDLRGR